MNKNWIRLCYVFVEYREMHGVWPNILVVSQGIRDNLRDHIFGPQKFTLFEAKVKVIVDSTTKFTGDPLIYAEYDGSREASSNDRVNDTFDVHAPSDTNLINWLGFKPSPKAFLDWWE